MNVTMKELPAFEVAYVRHVGSYLETYKAWAKLGEWAGQNGLFPPEQALSEFHWTIRPPRKNSLAVTMPA